MSRADRRRQKRQVQKIRPTPSNGQQSPSDDGGIQVIVYARDGYPPEGAIESLPQEWLRSIFILSNAPSLTGRALAIAGPRADAAHRAAQRGSTPYILFMDADCKLEDPTMVNVAIAHLSTGAAVVGALLVDHEEKVYAAGYTFAASGRPYFRLKGWSPDAPKVQTARQDMQALPWPFLMTRRDVYRRVGVRPDFADLPFADADYCCRAGQLGNIVYEPAIKVTTAGQLLMPFHEAAVHMLMASACPAYDEWNLL